MATIYGSVGDDSVGGGSSNDVLYGGVNSYDGTGRDTLYGGGGDDTAVGGSGGDTFFGGTGNDFLYGGNYDYYYYDDYYWYYDDYSGADTFYGGAGNDRLAGADGNDVYIFSEGFGQDQILGEFYGTNYVKFLDLTRSQVTFVLDDYDLYVQKNGSTDRVLISYWQYYSDSFVLQFADDLYSPVFLTPTQGVDTLIGSTAADTVFALGGNDFVYGGDGNDRLSGDAGNDVIRGHDGNDSITGGTGNDSINGGTGNDIIDGGADNDAVYYGDATSGVSVSLVTNRSAGPDGVDVLSNVEGVFGSTFGDTLTGNDSINRLHGAGGNDTILGGGGNDIMVGDSGNDVLRGQAGNDTIQGGGGNDAINGGLGNDTIDGGTETDAVYYGDATGGVTVSLTTNRSAGPDGVDVLSNIEGVAGSAFNDVLTGNTGANWLSGIGGNDTLFGGAGNDTLLGDSGNDSLFGNAGKDTLTGGSGNDSFWFDDNDSGLAAARDVITDFAAAGDKINLSLIDANTAVANDQAFVWKGAAALTGAAQVGFYVSGGVTIIRGSVDADAASEFEIQLGSGLTPASTWFVL